MQHNYVLGRNLRIGDRIEIWSPTMLGTIVSLEPYVGALAKFFKDGAQIAGFDNGDAVSGMTIDNDRTYRVVSQAPKATLGGYVLYSPISDGYRTKAGHTSDKLQLAELFRTHDDAVLKHQLGDVIKPLSNIFGVSP